MTREKMRQDAVAIFRRGLEAVDPIRCIRQHLSLRQETLSLQGKDWDLSRYRDIYVVGAGKAAAAMSRATEELLGKRLKAGVVNVKAGYGLPLQTIRVIEAGHPVPDRAGLDGTREIIQLLEKTEAKDLVICLLSGGGSALLPCPAAGLSLENKQEVTQLLLECGADIHEINALRKHISQVKGGRLARLAYPSATICLILSDVIGDDLGTIASGPTVPDPTSYGDCLRILQKYRILERVPDAVLDLLRKGEEGKIEETPKRDEPAFRQTQTAIIGSNLQAVEAAKQKAAELGFHPLVLSTLVDGETREVAKVHAAILKEILRSEQPIHRPACLISGGETTVTLKGSGLGGRNQEFALAAAIEIAGLETVVILSAGTDGTDGPTDAAGGVVDGTTVQRARKEGLDAKDFLARNDSYHFLERIGDLLVTGPTFTNVMDLRLLLAQ